MDASSNPTIKNSSKSKCHFYVCYKLDANFMFDQKEMAQIRNCSSSYPEVQEALNEVYFQLSKESILDGSFNLFNNNLFLTSIGFEISSPTSETYEGVSIVNRATIRYIKGFDIGKLKQRQNPLRMDFYYSSLDFYSNRSLIRSCEDLDQSKNISQYIVNAFAIIDARFYNCHYKIPICPLTILSMKISVLRFFGIQNTYYKRNYPRFLQSIPNSMLNYSAIIELDLVNMKNIELNSVILNEFLFSKIIQLRLFGDIVSIEKGLFKSFKKLQFIELDILSTRKLMHRIGIDWIFDLNSDINVDINVDINIDINSNVSLEIYFNEPRCVILVLFSIYEQGVNNAFINYT